MHFSFLENSVGDDLPVVAGEGRGAGQHVVAEDPETPPVHLLTMPTDLGIHEYSLELIENLGLIFLMT